MSKIYVPTQSPEDWKRLLAKPDLHWKAGRSARALAECWEYARGVPLEISRLLQAHFSGAELLIAIPEYKVSLPGGKTESQSDLFCLFRTSVGTLAVMIEGKVDEPFGPTLGEWVTEASKGKQERLSYISRVLGIAQPIPESIRYQLLHRTASAVITADRFGADAAAMIVHSFSARKSWFQDFQSFAALWGMGVTSDEMVQVSSTSSKLFIGWASGNLADTRAPEVVEPAEL